MTTRVTNLRRLVETVDKNWNRDKQIEPEYIFQYGRVFKGNTAKRGPYEATPTGFLKGSYNNVTLPGD